MPTGIASALLVASSAWRHIWNTAIDPLHGDGYQFWSGIGSDLMYFTGLAIFMRHHNCHKARCWRPGHIDPLTGHLWCRKHRPQLKENP